MCKQVYPKATQKRKAVKPVAHTAHHSIFPTTGSFHATVTLRCRVCNQYISHFHRPHPLGIDTNVFLPANFCLCSLSEDDLLALAQYGNPDDQNRVYALIFERIGAAVTLAGGFPSDVAAAVQAGEMDQLLLKVQAMFLLQEQGKIAERDSIVSRLSAAIKYDAYHVNGEDIADGMLRQIVQDAA